MAALSGAQERSGGKEAEEAKKQARYEQFANTLTGATLTGNFTVLGTNNTDLKPESYFIKRVTKQPVGDLWLFQTRIKYGGKDITLPLPLNVKWAGDTPVITLTNLKVPGLGTFSSRVVIYNGKYAGTWTHGKFGGHLFGQIEKEKAAAPKDKSENKTE